MDTLEEEEVEPLTDRGQDQPDQRATIETRQPLS